MRHATPLAEQAGIEPGTAPAVRLLHITAGTWLNPAGGLCRLSAKEKERERYTMANKQPWRAEPESNRQPAAVLQPCFPKHLPPVYPAGSARPDVLEDRCRVINVLKLPKETDLVAPPLAAHQGMDLAQTALTEGILKFHQIPRHRIAGRGVHHMKDVIHADQQHVTVFALQRAHRPSWKGSGAINSGSQWCPSAAPPPEGLLSFSRARGQDPAHGMPRYTPRGSEAFT